MGYGRGVPFSDSVRLGQADPEGEVKLLGQDWLLTRTGSDQRTLWRMQVGRPVSISVPFTDTLADIGGRGRWALITPNAGPLLLWDIYESPKASPLTGRDAAKQLYWSSIPISPDGRWLVTKGGDGRPQLCDVTPGSNCKQPAARRPGRAALRMAV